MRVQSKAENRRYNSIRKVHEMDILISAVPFVLIFFGILAVAFIFMKIIERNQIKKRLATKTSFPGGNNANN